MKKLFTLLFIALGTMSASAQLQFVDAQGKEVPNGTTLNIEARIIDDGFGDVLIEGNSGLSVKNTSANVVGTSVKWDVQQLDNGSVQVCFPANCVSHDAVGTYDTDKGTLAGNEVKELSSEWYADNYNAYGNAKVVYTLYAYDYNGLSYTNQRVESTITVNFSFTASAAIENVKAAQNTKEIFTLDGRRSNQMQKGVNLVRMSDGSVRKVLSK